MKGRRMTSPAPAARIYLRVSRKDEAPILDNQRRAALEYAAREGFVEAAIYSEIVSGAETERMGLGALLRDVRRGDIVIFTSLARMSRGGIGASLDILRQLEARGAGWHFTETPLLNYDSETPKLARDIIFAVLAAVAEDYRRRISEATKAKLAQLKGSGVKLGGRKIGSKNRPKSERSPSEPMKAEKVILDAPSR